MPTIRMLMDRMGQPPDDVALDWAWQIRQHLDSGPAANASLLDVRPWTELEVGEDGRLQCEPLDRCGAIAALEDLKHWAKCEGIGQSDLQETHSSSDESLSDIRLTNDCSIRNEHGNRLVRRASRSPGRAWRYSSAWIVGVAGLSVVGMTLWLAGGSSTVAPDPKVDNGLALAMDDESSQNKALTPQASLEDTQLESIRLLDLDERASPSNGSAEIEVQPDSGSAAVMQLDLAPSLGSPAASIERNNSELTPGPEKGQDLAVALAEPSGQVDSPATSSEEDPMREVQQAMRQAEQAESVVAPNHRPGNPQDTRGDPWILTRDTMRYRVSLSPKLRIDDRQSQWTLALEPIEGLVVEPHKPVTITKSGLAVWRIYDAEAKSPRAQLLVRAIHQGRDGQLEIAFFGGAEDMPGMMVPLGQRWLEPLTLRIQTHAIELRGALAQLSTTVILRSQIPAAMQTKQALTSQMLTATRLSVIMPDIHRLAALADGQVTMHASLKPKPDEPPIASWGHP